MSQVKFKIHKNRKTYAKIIKSIKGIPRIVSARKINKIISEKFNFTLIPIIQLSKETTDIMPIFRLRPLKEGEKIDESKESSFAYPPKNKVKMARANRKHQQVLYTCSNHLGAFYECEKQIKNNIKKSKNKKTIAYLSIWRIKDITDAVQMRNFCIGIKGKNDGSEASEFFNYVNERIEELIKNTDKEYKTIFLYAQKLYTELFLNKNSRYYHITSAISYNTFVHALEQKANIPIMSYPSVAMNHETINFAFRSDFVEKHIYLKEVYKVEIHSINKKTVDTVYLAKGVKENDVIEWKKMGFKIDSKDLDNVSLIHKDKDKIRKLDHDEFITDLETNDKMKFPQFLEYAGITDDMLLELAPKPDRPQILKSYDLPFCIEIADNIKIGDSKKYSDDIFAIQLLIKVSYGILD